MEAKQATSKETPPPLAPPESPPKLSPLSTTMKAKPATSSSKEAPPESPPQPNPLLKMILVASIVAGVQFGWALQLSLLSPYVQLLGLPNTWSAFIWLWGPISNLLVQLTVGYFSDRSTSRYGRRRPFIAVGAALVSLSIFLIGSAADIGHVSGDSLTASIKPRAVAVFVIGFSILDVGSNILQGPCRALLADLADDDQSKTRVANAFYSFFMAVGNVAGFAVGSYHHLFRLFPLSKTPACDIYCANLKSCFFLSAVLRFTLTSLALYLVPETPLDKHTASAGKSSHRIPVFGDIAEAVKRLSRPMWILLLVTCLNWVAWCSFLLHDTDWMGKEVYGGVVEKGENYDLGVRARKLGLMLNSVVVGVASLGVETLSKWAGGAKRLWGIANLLLAICLGMTVLVTKMAEQARHQAVLEGVSSPLPPEGVKVGALVLFSLMGIPLAMTYTIPFALASIFSSSSGAGQGLSLGVLNLGLVVPQMFISIASEPWGHLFGGGNLPTFVVGAVAALASGILALTILPSPPPEAKLKVVTSGH